MLEEKIEKANLTFALLSEEIYRLEAFLSGKLNDNKPVMSLDKLSSIAHNARRELK